MKGNCNVLCKTKDITFKTNRTYSIPGYFTRIACAYRIIIFRIMEVIAKKPLVCPDGHARQSCNTFVLVYAFA